MVEVKHILMVDLFITNKQLFASQGIVSVIWITYGL